MTNFQVPDLLVQLLLLKCWAGSLSLLASGFSERERLLFVSSGCRAAPSAAVYFGSITKVDALSKVVEVSTPEVGANVGPCSRMLYIKNKATQLLTIKNLRPSIHYLPSSIMISRRRS
jgi:tryptophanyl-tRNA synthetase